MPSRGRRRGVFEGLPRKLLRRAGERYVDACALGALVNGLVVAGFGVAVVSLYVDLGAGELALFAGCSAAGYALENLAAAAAVRRAGRPVTAWLARGDGEGDGAPLEAYAAAANLPLALVRHRRLYAVGLAGAAATSVVLAALLDLPAREALLALPVLGLMYVSSAILRYVGAELSARPLLEAIGAQLSEPPAVARVTLHQRLLVTVPMVTWGGAVVVAGFVTADARELEPVGLAAVVAFGVSAAISMWLSLVLADSVSAPIIDLRDATRRVGEGDLGVRVPVVSTDETGELTASFNTMVAGLAERARLREAFGAFVDPVLTERVLAEGTDLAGEELEVSILFVDVRGFTAFAERVEPPEVVAALDRLFAAVVPVVLRHGGHVNKFLGDGLMAVFGAPERHGDHAARAVATAREVAAVAPGALGEGLSAGVGVNSGRVVAGTVGGGGRRDFTVIGDAVNTAARVEKATRVTGDDLLITRATLDALDPDRRADFEEHPATPLRGKSAPVRLYAPRRRPAR